MRGGPVYCLLFTKGCCALRGSCVCVRECCTSKRCCVACTYEARAYAHACLVGGAYDRLQEEYFNSGFFVVVVVFLSFPENCLPRLLNPIFDCINGNMLHRHH